MTVVRRNPVQVILHLLYMTTRSGQNYKVGSETANELRDRQSDEGADRGQEVPRSSV